MPDTMQKDLSKFNRLLSLVDNDDPVSKEEFLKAFENVVFLVKKMEQMNMTALNRLEEMYRSLEKKIITTQDGNILNIKSDLKREFGVIKTKTDELLRTVSDRLAEIRDGEPGKDADELKIIETVKEQIKIPVVEEVMKDIPKLASDIKNALEMLQGEDRLSKESINGLDEEIKRLEFKIANRGGGTVGQPRNAVQYADLSAQLDGATKSFEVPRHRFAVSLTGTQFPIIYRPGIDFTTANKTLTLTDEVAAPETGQSLIFLYIK